MNSEVLSTQNRFMSYAVMSLWDMIHWILYGDDIKVQEIYGTVHHATVCHIFLFI